MDPWNIAIPVRFTPVYHVSHVVKEKSHVHEVSVVRTLCFLIIRFSDSCRQMKVSYPGAACT